MSDLSQLLGELYADETPARAPSWSSEEALDDAFSSWVPGPSVDAAPAEHRMVADAMDAPIMAPAATSDEWQVDTAPIPDAATESRLRWTPSDDDILPRRAGKTRRRSFGR